MSKTIPLVAIVLVLALSAAAGDDEKKLELPNLSGSWLINADGQEFRLNIKQSEARLEGSMLPLGRDEFQSMPIKGKIDQNWRVTFRRHGANQNYVGFLFHEKRKVGRHMAGFFGRSENITDHHRAWFAEEFAVP